MLCNISVVCFNGFSLSVQLNISLVNFKNHSLMILMQTLLCINFTGRESFLIKFEKRSLRIVCDVAIDFGTHGNPKMKGLGEDMKRRLEEGA